MENNGKTAILILTHVENRSVDRLISHVTADCDKHYDVYILRDNTIGQLSKRPLDGNYFLFDTTQLAKLGYPGKCDPNNFRPDATADQYHKDFHFTAGNVELPVFLFFRHHPDYAFYWTIEYDVRFTGRWDVFFANFDRSEADLLGTTLTRRAQVPEWYHWPSLDLSGKDISADKHLRGFFPIYRLSRRALLQLDRDYRDGVRGHFECLVPTLLNHAGMAFEDIGGDGEFVAPANRNRFYRNVPARPFLGPGTFIYRPAMRHAGKEKDMLWHPVKYVPLWKAATSRLLRKLRPVAARIARDAGSIPAPRPGRNSPERIVPASSPHRSSD